MRRVVLELSLEIDVEDDTIDVVECHYRGPYLTNIVDPGTRAPVEDAFDLTDHEVNILLIVGRQLADRMMIPARFD